MIPTPTEIEYFIEVYRTKHVSRSAIRLGVTQPTLTQSLQRLEEKLQTPLFLRSKRGVVPTPAGDAFHAQAQTLLESWRNLSESIQVSQTELKGRFRVGCHPCVGAYTVPSFLASLTEKAPEIGIDLIHDSSRKITEAIVSYGVDLGFVVNPAKHPDLVLKKIGNDRVVFWKKRGLKTVPKRIFADVDTRQIEVVLEKSHQKMFRDWTVVQSASLELVRTLTLSGQGIGILPERVALADGADLVEYDERLPSFNDEIYVAYRKEVLTSVAGRALVQCAAMTL